MDGRVRAQINKHNHRLSEHLFKSYSESRVVIDDELVVPGAMRVKDEAPPSPLAGADGVGHHGLDDHALKSAYKGVNDSRYSSSIQC